MKYIDADRLRAEIEKERKILEATRQGCGLTEYGCGRWDAFRLIVSIIDWLQKQQPNVDLEKEIDDKIEKMRTAPCYDELEAYALHFFDLGRRCAI